MDKILEITMFHDIYRSRRVLITGHTGFKGSWLAYFLQQLGAEVCGVALPPPEGLNLFRLLKLDMRSEFLDIRDPEKLRKTVADFRPEAVFHLAAQALVRRSYREPAETFSSNVMGTVHLLEACRLTPGVKAVVVITSDKCYENREQVRGYAETDPMGGYDPYSASKGCAELAVAGYRRSFFNNADYGVKHHTLVASARAGNVIGGGDWAEDRLVPDLMQAASAGRTAVIRNPGATRPWQHVLEPLSGYLSLGEKLLKGETKFADGWNFGPDHEGMITVGETAAALAEAWDAVKFSVETPQNAPHEAHLLKLDCSKAHHELLWHGVWSPKEAFRRTAVWYRDFYTAGKLRTGDDLASYLADAETGGLEWTK